MIKNIYRMQTYDSIIVLDSYWIYYFVVKGKILLDYTNLFSRNNYEKVILKYF